MAPNDVDLPMLSANGRLEQPDEVGRAFGFSSTTSRADQAAVRARRGRWAADHRQQAAVCSTSRQRRRQPSRSRAWLGIEPIALVGCWTSS